MEYRSLGRTGLKVSQLCLGCMSYGDPGWRPWVQDEAAARPFFKHAIEAGIIPRGGTSLATSSTAKRRCGPPNCRSLSAISSRTTSTPR